MTDTNAASAEDGAWRPIETAPKDGQFIWVWLYDNGIRLVRWYTAEENAELDNSSEPSEYISCWSEDDRGGEWCPKFWIPFDAIPVPPGVVTRLWEGAMTADCRNPANTPLEQWPSAWLKLEVSSLYDVPEYLVMNDEEKRKAQMPVGDEEMREFITARRETDAMLANPDLIP